MRPVLSAAGRFLFQFPPQCIACMSINDKCAAELRALADEARRMPPPNRRNPHAFHEARDEIAQRLLDIANVLVGNISIGRRPEKRFVQDKPVVSRSGNVVPFETRNKKRP